MTDFSDGKPLRSGWTTGACATAAAKAACQALFGEASPDTVQITLPRGETPCFPLAQAAGVALGDAVAAVQPMRAAKGWVQSTTASILADSSGVDEVSRSHSGGWICK